MTEDKSVIEWNVDHYSDKGYCHNRPGDAPAGKKGRECSRRYMQNASLAENIEVDGLEMLHLPGVAGQFKNLLCTIHCQQPEKEAGTESEVDPLPEHGADPIMVASAGVLGNEHSGITAYTAEKGKKKIRGDSCRQESPRIFAERLRTRGRHTRNTSLWRLLRRYVLKKNAIFLWWLWRIRI